MDGLMILVKSGPEETARVEEALRITATLLGYDVPPDIVFIGDGVRCLRLGAFSDPALQDYLQAAADLAGIHAVKSDDKPSTDLDPALEATMIDTDELATMMRDHSAVASY